MSKVIPGPRDEMLDFYANHIETWDMNQASIGLGAPELTALKEALDAALLQRGATQQLRQNARTATDVLNAKAALVRSLGGAAMSTIRGYAEATDPAVVYAKADLPMPKPPTPAGPPVAPTSVVADPNATGTITLKIKGSVAQNASFEIERSVDGGPYVLIKPTRSKTWTDEAVPMNTNVIIYRVWGARDDVRSQTATSATVNFGNLPAEILAAFRTNGIEPQAEAA